MDEKVRTDEIEELDRYIIYKYLVDHPSVLIAVVSAIVAIASFFINFISYMKEYQILRFWNVTLR